VSNLVKRFNPAQMVEAFNGGWVRSSDYDRLEDALAAMTKDRDYHRAAAMEQSEYWRNHYCSAAQNESNADSQSAKDSQP
jgi:hypothetical protein